MRDTGIAILGDVPWGTHFCQFYESRQDLIDILVPYFKAGLENNESCLWITSEPLPVEEAKAALAEDVANLDDYLRQGQIQFLDHTQWYTAGEGFDSGKVLQRCADRIEAARAKGFEGLRLTDNVSWLEKANWQGFTGHESALDQIIGRYPVLALCTYSLTNCGAVEILDVISNHAFAAIKRTGKWQIIENAGRKRFATALLQSEEQRHRLASELEDRLTKDLAIRKQETETLHQLERTLKAHNRSNQALLHATEEAAYLREVCRIIVEDCNHAMVWVGFREEDEAKTVRPVAYSGFEEGYLETLRITWADTERGRGPTGAAVRTGKVCSCRNMLTDPQFLPWRENAINRGYASSIVFPLLTGGKILGALSIYSTEPDPFSESETKFLTDLASDFAYGINVLRLRAAHALAEKTLHEGEARYRSLAELRIREVSAANRELEAFTYSVSHDLRAPLRHIDAFSTILADRTAGKLNDAAQNALNRIRNGAKQMSRMIDELLEFSQMGRKEVARRRTVLRAVVDASLELLSPAMEGRNIELRVGPLPSVDCDPALLEHVTVNLLSNAIKFTRGKEPAVIEVGHSVDHGVVVVFVRDNGIGFDMRFADKLFGIFQRLHRQEDYEGVGVGLATVQRIVHKHGGRIWAESEPGKGTTFYFTMSDVPNNPQERVL